MSLLDKLLIIVGLASVVLIIIPSLLLMG